MASFNLSIKNLTYRLRKFKDVLDQELKNEILKNEDFIVRMIAQEQLYKKGVDGVGVKLRDIHPYAPSTIKKKKRKGQVTNRVTLRDTGKMYESLHIEFDSEGFYVTSTVEYEKYLKKKYGKTIFRLSNANLTRLLDGYVKPQLRYKLLKYLRNG